MKQITLEVCLATLAALDYGDELEMIIEGDEEEMGDIVGAVEAIEGVSKAKIKKFKRELAKLRGKGENL